MQPALSPDRVAANWLVWLRLGTMLILCLLIFTAPLLLAIFVAGMSTLAALLPPALSLSGNVYMLGTYFVIPECQTAHLGQIVCLTAANTWYSTAWLLFLFTADVWSASARCATFKLSLAGWVASLLWALPICCDWLLLMQGDRRSHQGSRRVLSHACHVVWLLAAGLALPLIRADAQLVMLNASLAAGDDAIFGFQAGDQFADGAITAAVGASSSSAAAAGASLDMGAWSLPVCTLSGLTPSWWRYVLGATIGSALLLPAIAYAVGLWQARGHTPLVVWARHSTRTPLMTFASLILQPPTAAFYWYLLSSPNAPSPPSALPMLALWGLLLGAPWQGAVNAFTHALHEPTLRPSWPTSCRCMEEAECTRSTQASLPQLAHADSRFVHFEEAGSGALAHPESSEGEADAMVAQALAEVDAADAAADLPFRWAIGIVLIALVALGFGLVLVMHL